MQTPRKKTGCANRLAHAVSPYLLQHARNPVDWYEWGREAIERAGQEYKPIFLSIGYSACHWCHVMERESFENPEVARALNEHFVCVKVDREERPDLDEIYMAATQAFTGSGGWPMSVWLTPDLKPFYAGTYFPPEARYGRPGFKQLLLFLAKTWREDREKIADQADVLTAAVQAMSTVPTGSTKQSASTIPPHGLVAQTAVQLASAFDPIKGGMTGGGTNKFPPALAMDLMLRASHRVAPTGADKQRQAAPDDPTDAGVSPADQDETDAFQIAPGEAARLLELVELTLEKMAHGGIYDQLGGGIARYSTDADWLVPHFEKMLYDQALVSDVYLKAYQRTGKPLYARIAREMLDYVIEDLRSPEGGFYCTRDADSEGVEGRFYVWTKAEVMNVLGPRDGPLFCDAYDVTEDGNWEGRNILNVPRPLEVVAKLHAMPLDELQQRLTAAKMQLWAVREQRTKPHLDDKILASWNGLMISSLAKGCRILGEPRYRKAATGAADFVLRNMMQVGRLHRVYRNGQLRTPGYLDDHAFMIEALLALHETTFETRWLTAAVDLNDCALRLFRDAQAGGFFYTATGAERLIVRPKSATDGALPSGNSVQATNLLRLGILLDRPDLTEEAARTLGAFSPQLAESPYASSRMLAALDFHHGGRQKIAFAAERQDDRFDALVGAAWRAYLPNAVFAAVVDDERPASARVEDERPLQGRPAAYVCEGCTCLRPTDDPEVLFHMLAG